MKIIILDRDGVINHDSDQYIKTVDEWLPITGSIDAICKLYNAGYTVVVATNQSGLGRNYFDEIELAKMHEKLSRLVDSCGGKVAGIFYCPHLPEDKCSCRKPAVGLLRQIEKEFNCSVEGCYFVGDSIKDILAARAAKCIPVLVKTGKGEETYHEHKQSQLIGVEVFDSLAAFTTQLL